MDKLKLRILLPQELALQWEARKGLVALRALCVGLMLAPQR
jgi:hypothetical protein